MKWFKVLSNTPHTDWYQQLDTLVRPNGVQSWFELTCFFAEQYQAHGTWTIRMKPQEWCKVCSRNMRTLQRFFRVLRDLGVIRTKTSRHFIEVTYLKLLWAIDDTTRNLEGPSKPLPSSDPGSDSGESEVQKQKTAVENDRKKNGDRDGPYRSHISKMLKRFPIADPKEAVHLAIAVNRPPDHLYRTLAFVNQARARQEDEREKWLVVALDHQNFPPMQEHEDDALDMIRSFNALNACQVDKDPVALGEWQLKLTDGVVPPRRQQPRKEE